MYLTTCHTHTFRFHEVIDIISTQVELLQVVKCFEVYMKK